MLFFGSKWLEIIPLVELFAIGAIFYSINNLFISLLIVKNETGLIYQSTFLRRGIVLMTLLISFSFGLKAIAFGRALAEFFNLLVSFFYVKKALGVKILTQAYIVLPYCVSAALAALLMQFVLGIKITSIFFIQFALNAIIFAILYLIIVRILFKKDYDLYGKFITHSKQSLLSLITINR